ncbi:PREDICTED: uncharacterized protein LOC106819298, partial [Priapulus caudatus]|uniref:Uncharacterized protein LOC106819298 n=1 Tax=Priapulus caudatus TaxID=37621 RepID=A0ABM1F4Q9_PRICU
MEQKVELKKERRRLKTIADAIQADVDTAKALRLATEYISENVKKRNSRTRDEQKAEGGESELRAAEVKTEAKYSIDSDMHHNLKRVPIPTFRGDKQDYPIFRDAFYQCVDKASCGPSFKMLQLRQYLGGDASKTIEGFPASEAGYEAAKRRLEERYGGERRILLAQLNGIRQFHMVRQGDTQALDAFQNKLELAIVALAESGRTEELENDSMFYCVSKSKFQPSQIAHYKRWLSIEGRPENLHSLRKWISEELRIR